MIVVLRFLHGSGWVHRDISAGNVYLFDGRGVLGDLEYPKKTDDTTQHEVRTVCGLGLA
jgi:serine/threonine protein kinase